MSKYYALISIIYYALVVFISMMFIKNIFIYIFISVTAMLLGKYFVNLRYAVYKYNGGDKDWFLRWQICY